MSPKSWIKFGQDGSWEVCKNFFEWTFRFPELRNPASLNITKNDDGESEYHGIHWQS